MDTLRLNIWQGDPTYIVILSWNLSFPWPILSCDWNPHVKHTPSDASLLFIINSLRLRIHILPIQRKYISRIFRKYWIFKFSMQCMYTGACDRIEYLTIYSIYTEIATATIDPLFTNNIFSAHNKFGHGVRRVKNCTMGILWMHHGAFTICYGTIS